MFIVTTEDADAIRTAFFEEGEITAAIEVRRVTVHTPLPSGCQLRGDAGQR